MWQYGFSPRLSRYNSRPFEARSGCSLAGRPSRQHRGRSRSPSPPSTRAVTTGIMDWPRPHRGRRADAGPQNVVRISPDVARSTAKAPPFSMRGVPAIAANPREGSRLLRFWLKAPSTNSDIGTTRLSRARSQAMASDRLHLFAFANAQYPCGSVEKRPGREVPASGLATGGEPRLG
jgi:hypothetical protein